MAMTTATIGSKIPSLGFSGAGFLACYHMGASSCLQDHGYLNKDNTKKNPILTGVSGGALIASATALGVNPEVVMQTTLQVAKDTRQKGGLLDAFRPG